jgi:hypothetical protein
MHLAGFEVQLDPFGSAKARQWQLMVILPRLVATLPLKNKTSFYGRMTIAGVLNAYTLTPVAARGGSATLWSVVDGLALPNPPLGRYMKGQAVEAAPHAAMWSLPSRLRRSPATDRLLAACPPAVTVPG